MAGLQATVKTLKPLLRTLQPTLKPYRAGDDRIRGTALQKIRDRILSRDCGMCQCERCKATGAVRPATIVDHIVPLWAGGSEDDSNRQAINEACHLEKSAAEARQRGR